MQREGNIPEHDMCNTFNMGIGMTLVVDKTDAQKTVDILAENGEKAYIIGETISGDEGVVL